MKRRRNRDRYQFGPGVPSLKSFDWRHRHGFRKKEANADLSAARVWAKARGVYMEVTNFGHHWLFTRRGTIAEWWPSSAKLVLQKLWTDAVHVHLWEDLKKILDVAFPLDCDVEIVGRRK